MSELFEGFAYLGSGTYWAALGVAVVTGVFIGLLPGVSTTLVMAVSIPFIVLHVEDPVIGIVALATLAGVGSVVDPVSPVLLGVPGASEVTFIEGNQLARKGHAAHTLGAAYAVSVMGGLIGALVLALALFVAASVYTALPVELVTGGSTPTAAVALFSVAIVALLSSGAMLKGLAAAALGLLIGTSGLDPIEGVARYTFGAPGQWEILLLAATITGAFALAEAIDLTMTRQPVAPQGTSANRREVFRGVRYGLATWRTAVRQGLFGALVGVAPVGGAAVDWLSYATGIFFTKDKSQFGRGSLDGLLFVESATSAHEAVGAVPTFLFGIPGSRAWAFVLVAMLAYGIAPGSGVLEESLSTVTAMVFSLTLGMLAVAVVGVLVTGHLVKLTRIPYPVIGAIVMPLLFLGAFGIGEGPTGIHVMVAAAVLGLLMKRYKWPRPPLIVGLLLSSTVEYHFHSAVTTHGIGGALIWPMLIVSMAAAAAVVAIKKGRVGVADAPPEEAAAQRRIAVTPQGVFTMAIVSGAAWALYEATTFPLPGKVFPLLTGLAVVVLCVVQLVFDLRQGRMGAIMDIGMRSAGMEGARKTALLMSGMIAVFMALLLLAGLKYATIIFPLGPTLLFLKGRTRWIGATVGVAFMAAFNLAFLDSIGMD